MVTTPTIGLGTYGANRRGMVKPTARIASTTTAK